MNANRTVTVSILSILLSFGLGVLTLSASPPQPPDSSYTIESFRVGSEPQYLTFDGANIWVTNFLPTRKDGPDYTWTVTKLRASDGERLGDFPVGGNPYYLTFDGENIWVSNLNGRSITKLRASDGAVLGTFLQDNDNPEGIAWDGANIWVALYSGSVAKLATDGTRLLTVPVGYAPQDLIFDGTYIWVANLYDKSVDKIQTDGTIVAQYFAGHDPFNLVSDGAKIWVTNYGSRRRAMTVLRASDGMQKGVIGGRDPGGIAFDGSNIWVATNDYDIHTVTRLRAKDGKKSGIYQVDPGPLGVLFDGTSIWVACSGANTVNKLTPSAQ